MVWFNIQPIALSVQHESEADRKDMSAFGTGVLFLVDGNIRLLDTSHHPGPIQQHAK